MRNAPNITSLQDKSIFIVEDNVENRIIFQMIFIKCGANAHFERRGRDTLRQLNAVSRVDLIIMDLMLKDNVSGFDLYDEIRAIPKFASTPVVAVSAMDPSIAIPTARAKGLNGFIAKPIDNHLFPKQVAALLEGEQVWYTGERYYDHASAE